MLKFTFNYLNTISLKAYKQSIRFINYVFYNSKIIVYVLI